MTNAGAQPLYRIKSAIEAAQLVAIREHERVVLVFGPGAVARDVNGALDVLAERAPRTRCTSIVLGARDQMADFRPLIDAGRLFYLSCGDLPERQLDALIDGARNASVPEVPADLFLAGEHLRRMAGAESVADVADAVERAIGSVIETRRSRCVLEAGGAVGLVSFIVRTGKAVWLRRLAGDPRVDLDLDNPDGQPSDRFLGVPVRAARGEIVAVLVAVRPEQNCPFDPDDIAILETLAAYAGPYLSRFAGGEHERVRETREAALRGPR